MEKKPQFQFEKPFEPAGGQPQAINGLLEGIRHGEAEQILLGVTGSGKTFTMASVINESKRPALVMAHNKTLAAQLYSEFKSFFPNNCVEYFVSYYDYYQPEAYVVASDLFIEKDASINEQIEQMRLSATKALLERNDVIIVATVSAIYGLGDPSHYLKMILHLSVGHVIDRKGVARQLASMQYTRNDMELARGTFRIRGEIIDIFPAEQEKEAIRIHLFDDEIEKLEIFDPLTGHVSESLQRYTVYPKTHYVTPKEQLNMMMSDVKAELVERVAYFEAENKLLEAQRIAQRTRYDLEMMAELGYCQGIENYSRYLSGRDQGQAPPTLFDYVPDNTLLFIDESHVTVPQIGAMYNGDQSRKRNLVDYGFRLPSALDNRPLKFQEFTARNLQTIYVSATPGKYELGRDLSIIEQVIRPTGLLDPVIDIRPATFQVDDLLGEIRQVIVKKERVLVTTLTKKMSEDLTDYLSAEGIKVRYLHSSIDTVERVEILRDLRKGAFDVLVGINLLREGLDLPEVSLVAILDADKEGFLRSGSALIQTIGRAARNANGRVILYADKETDSMKYAIGETRRRREIQSKFNKDNNITPATVKKKINDILDVYRQKEAKTTTKTLDPKELARQIKQKEKQMHQMAKDLKFEEAAQLRDEIHDLRNGLIFSDK